VDCGTTPIGSRPGSAIGGRSREARSFRSVTVRPAAAAAKLAARKAVGIRRRCDASPAAPTSAMSGHFTHHIDATTKRSVSGLQRTASPACIAAPSHSASWLRTADKAGSG
jgi:hypothetical protein